MSTPTVRLVDMTHDVTFIHTSDLQLGMTYWFLEGEAQARFAQDRNEAIARLGQLATRTGAAFIVVAGDVFENNSLSKQTVNRAKEEFEHLPVPVYLLPGNHDPLVADSSLALVDGGNVHVIKNATVCEVAPRVELVGAPYLTKRATEDIVAAALEPLEPTEAIRIMVGHGQVASFSSEPAPDLIDLPTVESALSRGTIDYLALGDTHSTASLGSTGRVWFSGSPETTAFHELAGDKGENASGNALVVRVTKEGTRSKVEVSQHIVGRWTFDAVSAEINSQEDVAAFLAMLEAYPDKPRTVIKYSLTGTINLSAQQALEDGLERWRETFAALYERKRTMDLVLEPEVEELSSLGLTGYAKAGMEELVGAVGTDPVARDAANLLFRLSRKGA